MWPQSHLLIQPKITRNVRKSSSKIFRVLAFCQSSGLLLFDFMSKYLMGNLMVYIADLIAASQDGKRSIWHKF